MDMYIARTKRITSHLLSEQPTFAHDIRIYVRVCIEIKIQWAAGSKLQVPSCRDPESRDQDAR